MYIEKINGPADVKRLSAGELETLSEEVRGVLLKKLSEHGGHVGPNLGMVEATVALHYVFNSPADKIVYDVSHQSYAHKILTGRKAAFMDAAAYDEVSGYTEPSESEHDFFVIGHTSTSVSLATGLAKARDLKGGTGNVIAVIGDGSLSGGEAFEGLNNAAELDHGKKSQKATTKRQVLQNQYFVGLFLLPFGDLDRQKEGIDGQKIVPNSYPRQDFQKRGTICRKLAERCRDLATLHLSHY